jgi:hypothetical protein
MPCYNTGNLKSNKMRTTFNILHGKPEDKTLFGRPGCRYIDNVKMHLKEMG